MPRMPKPKRGKTRRGRMKVQVRLQAPAEGDELPRGGEREEFLDALGAALAKLGPRASAEEEQTSALRRPGAQEVGQVPGPAARDVVDP